MLRDEGQFLGRVRSASNAADEASTLNDEMDELLEENLEHPLWGLDLGVASATLALSAAGCVTYSSCNGGAFGEGRHHEAYPLIAFFMRARVAAEIEAAASEAGVGLHMHGDGSLQIYSPSRWGMYEFATRLYHRRASIKAANRTEGRRAKRNQAKTPDRDLFD